MPVAATRANWSTQNNRIAFTGMANGHGQVGFINPLIYSIAAGPDYQSDFHDIVMGTCMFPNNPTEFTAAPGFDLCSGWGSPHGQALIDALRSWPHRDLEFESRSTAMPVRDVHL